MKRVRRLAAVAVLAVLAAAVLVAASEPAFARLGGGQGYSGGRSSGGGGGGGEGALFEALFRLLFWLILTHPAVGIPLVVVVIIVIVRFRGSVFVGSAAAAPTIFTGAFHTPGPRRRADLRALRTADRTFSEPLFVDFAQLVYTRAHEARGSGKSEVLEGWLAPEVIAALLARRDALEAVREIIFGATRIVSFRAQAGFDLLEVDFETNLTEVRAGAEAQLLCRERWTFRRKSGVLSPGPERMQALGCAGCGSTLEPKTDGTCPNCGVPRKGGLTQWEVARIVPLDRRPLTAPELALGGGVEPGTDLPTVFDPDVAAMRRKLETRHPDHSWPEFGRRAREVFAKLQQAWSTQRWEDARPYETDALFQVHRFWIERYKRFGLRNRIEQVSVAKVEVAAVEFDAFYEAITVRIFASCLDWTEDAQGGVVGGSKDDPRVFSEYWTWLRSAGTRKRAAGGDVATCPSCGAPVDKINMAGICEYCGSKITSGEFDWVLSRIEQDDAY